MEKCKLKLFIFSVLISFIATVTFYKRYRYEFYRNYDEQRLMLYSEESFYFSFYNDLISANSYKEGLNLIIKDNRSEYPDTINAIKRFNIYPEIILGTIWRILNLKSVFATPFNFYTYAAILSQGASVSVLFFFSVYIGKSYFCGITFLILFFSCFREKFIVRLSAFPLRENFASVYMWCNILLIYIILKDRKDALFKYICLFFSSFFFFIFWQFSMFVSLTHIVSLFIVELLGYDISKKLNYLLITLLSSYFLSIIVMLFPRYSLYTYFPFVLTAILITNILFNHWRDKKKLKVDEHTNINTETLCGDALKDGQEDAHEKHNLNKKIRKRKSNKDKVEKNNVEKSENVKHDEKNLTKIRHNLLQKVKSILAKGLTSICIFVILRLLIFSKEKDDSHVLSLLMVRLKLANHNFDSMIYSLGSEFSPFSVFMYKMLKESALYEYIHISGFICILYIINYFTYKLKGKKQNLNYEMLGSSFVFLIIQIIFFVLLMIIIARLRVLALPLLCIFGSLVGSSYIIRDLYAFTVSNFVYLKCDNNGTRLKKYFQKLIIYAIGLSSCFYAVIKFFPTKEYLNNLDYKPSNFDKNLDLVIWLKNNIKQNEVLIADMPTSSFLRAITNFKLVLHPQYEDSSLRKRVQDFYMFSACPPFSDVKKYFYEKYKVRYFINNIYRCTHSGSDINVFSISDKIESNYAKCNNKNSMRFCNRVLYDNKNYQTLFRNGKYSVIYFNPEVIEDNTPYEMFNPNKFSNIKYYEPWLNKCKQTDDKCALHIAETARTIWDLQRYRSIVSVLYNYVETNFLDKNIYVINHLAEYYDYDLKITHKANQLYKKVINLIIKDKNDTSRYIIGQTPFISLSKKISIISSYLYFLVEYKLDKDRKEIFLLYKNMSDLVDTILFALENGYYYEKLTTSELDQGELIVKRYLYRKDLDKLVDILCQNSTYIYYIKNENTQYASIYKNFWTLIKKTSYLNECVIQTFHIFENKKLNLFDYFKFFYVYR